MNKLLVIILSLTLFGCKSQESNFVNNRILRDTTDCAFIARSGSGAAIFLYHMKELSGPQCNFLNKNL